MIIDYEAQKTFTQSIDIVDPGDAALQCISGDGSEYYIITKTVLGFISFIEFGPVIDGVNCFLENFTLQYKKMKFKERAIYKEFNTFLNDPAKKILEATEISPALAITKIPAINECWETV